MSDDLNHLRGAKPPPPRLAAKKRALAAGAAAFKEAQAQAPKISVRAQGKTEAPRLTLASEQNARSRFMRARTYYALAASVAVVALGAPMAFELWKSANMRGTFGNVSAQLDGPKEKPARTQPLGKNVPAPQAKSESEADALRRSDLQARTESAPAPTAAQPAPPPAPKPAAVASAPASAPMPAAPLTTAGRATETGAQTAQAPAGVAGKGDMRDDTKQRLARQKTVSETKLAQTEAAPPPIPEPRAAQPGDADARYNGALTAADGLAADAMQPQMQENRDRFANAPVSPVHHAADEPVSTFSIDVDTASYAFARRAINNGQLPPRASVRVEEMVNYFPYDYPRPETASVPFKPTVTVAPSPWAGGNKLMHIAIKGYDIQRMERPRANIVLLIDVSGSMEPQDRLPLLKNAYRMMLDELQPQDTVAIVTYANGVSTALPPTKVANKQRIIAAIDRLNAGGGTAGADGLQRAYQLAQENFDAKGVNRIILGTDGDFNLGISDVGELKSFIERKRATGIYLSVLGVGQGNHNDELMQALAQNGNGNAAYIDTLSEARKVLADEVSSTLFPIAKDVKIQIEFNPAAVSDYRLIGYETRALKREDFNNDKVDAGDIGSGHTVTAIYEITPRGAPGVVDELRYGAQKGPEGGALRVAPSADEAEYAFLKLRYKLPDEDTSRLLTLPVTRDLEVKRLEDAPREMRFSVAVAAFGQLLQGAPYLRDFGYDQVLALASNARGEDAFGYRAEFLKVARLAKSAR